MIAMNSRLRNTSPTGRVTFRTTHPTHFACPGGTAAAGAPATADRASAVTAGGCVSALTVQPSTAPRASPARMRVCGTVCAADMPDPRRREIELRQDYGIYPIAFIL